MNYFLDKIISEFFNFNNKLPMYIAIDKSLKEETYSWFSNYQFHTSQSFYYNDILCKFIDVDISDFTTFAFRDNTVIKDKIKVAFDKVEVESDPFRITLSEILKSHINLFEKTYRTYPYFMRLPSELKPLIDSQIERFNIVDQNRPSSMKMAGQNFFLIFGIRTTYTNTDEFTLVNYVGTLTNNPDMPENVFSDLKEAYSLETKHNTEMYTLNCKNKVYNVPESDYDRLIVKTSAFLSAMSDLSDEGRLDSFKFQEIASQLSVDLLQNYSRHFVRNVFTSQHEIVKDLEQEYLTQDNTEQ